MAIASSGGLVGCLLAPEVIIPMALVALGLSVGFASQSNVIKEIADSLENNYSSWTVLQGGGGLGDGGNDKRPFLKGWYKAGKVFLSEILIGIIAKIGIDKGYFDGLKQNIDYEFDTNITIGGQINKLMNMHDLYIFGMNYYNNNAKGILNTVYQSISNVIDTTKYSGFYQLSITTNSEYVYVYLIESINLPLTVYQKNLYSDSVYNVWTNAQNVTFRKLRIDVNDGSILSDSIVNNDMMSPVYIGYTNNINAGHIVISGINAGKYVNDEGIPNTGNVPEFDSDTGVTELPDWNPLTQPIATPDGEALPVSLPDGAEIPLIYPPSEMPLNWPDLTILPYQWPDSLPSDPTANDQDQAQVGDTDFNPAVDIPENIDGGQIFNSLMLPSDIKKKYPFCIIYDLYDIYNIVFYGNNTDSAVNGININNANISSSFQNEFINPVIPSFTWDPPDNVIGLSQVGPVTISLNNFVEVAFLLRFMFLVLTIFDISVGAFELAKGGD